MVLSTDTDIGILLGLAYARFVDELRADLAARGFADLGPSYGYVFRVLGDGERSLSELAGLLGLTLPRAGGGRGARGQPGGDRAAA